ncbi:serine/threonine protein kinase [Dictyobacter kobayashii]|uniref:Protein kinase domain-containing protein n=1 Tax=Dictyobacter kobayashii TaxID=2014872 RepID=A0A402AKV3_9CHLR|nr:serine/threonine-protein kinase [Dictyobacter kobayashii]GCE19751.1 hypothetical protein KDK_35510 [Dictyobacter kobayashii]
MISSSRPLETGTLIRDRYKVESVLGSGGSSIVYLVRDLARTEETLTEDNYFALKELLTTSKQEQFHFAFEGRVLKRLQHPALPRVYEVYGAKKQQASFLVLEYIAGCNLEILRRQQVNQRFALAEVMKFMQPIIEATTYLHHQRPPIIHRDIKPANIIIKTQEQRAVLIDFGIAKEYEADATTIAMRHCTPGYGSPEQYGNLSTDERTDIYALGATFYSLLTGIVPVDAFQRATTIVSKRIDPLKPAHELVAEIPLHISQAIERAMEIGTEQRFAKVEDFWAALQKAPEQEQKNQSRQNAPDVTQTARKTGQRRQLRTRLIVLVAAMLLFGTTLGASLIHNTLQHPQPTHTSSIPRSQQTRLPLPGATAAERYPHISTAYKGTLSNLATQTRGSMSLTNIQQQQQRLSGHFSGLNRTGDFTGVLDASNHILLTIPGSAQQPPLFFEGIVRSDGNLVGDYCNQDQAGQCLGNYGVWSLAPA